MRWPLFPPLKFKVAFYVIRCLLDLVVVWKKGPQTYQGPRSDPGCPGSHQRLTSDLRCDWSHVVYGTSRQHPPPKALIPAIYFYRRRPGRTRLFIQTPVVIPSSAMHRLARGMAEGSWQICNVRFLEGQGKSGVKLRL